MTKPKIQIKSPPLPARPAGGRQAGKIQTPNTRIKVYLFAICHLLFFCNLSFVISIFPVYAEDKIVAIVNNEVITQKDLDDFLNFMTMQLSREYQGKALEEKVASAKPDLLSRLIEDRLILQEAKKEKINLDQARIREKVSEVKKRYNSDADFQAELMKQGLTQADIENKIREQFLMYAIVEHKVRSAIMVRPDEVTEFYQKHKKEFKSGEERELEAYALENDDLASSFAYNLRIGKTPQELAVRYPYTVNKFNVTEGESLKKEIEETVFTLGINEVSGAIKMDDKYYVFRLINIIPSRELGLSDVQNKIQSYVFERKMQEELIKWIDGLKKKSYIKIK